MAKKTTTTQHHDYKGFSDTVSLILAIIPITSLIFGLITRYKEGKIIAFIVRLFIGWNIVWIVDLVYMIMHKRIFRLLNM